MFRLNLDVSEEVHKQTDDGKNVAVLAKELFDTMLSLDGVRFPEFHRASGKGIQILMASTYKEGELYHFADGRKIISVNDWLKQNDKAGKALILGYPFEKGTPTDMSLYHAHFAYLVEHKGLAFNVPNRFNCVYREI